MQQSSWDERRDPLGIGAQVWSLALAHLPAPWGERAVQGADTRAHKHTNHGVNVPDGRAGTVQPARNVLGKRCHDPDLFAVS